MTAALPCILGIAVVLLAISDGGDAIIGLNWGRLNAQRLVPSQVVDLILQNGVRYARVYSIEEDILKAFSNSGISLTVTVTNYAEFTSMEVAEAWVDKVGSYFDTCNISNVFLGELATAMNMNKRMIQAGMKSLTYLQNALNKTGRGYVKASFIHSIFIFKDPTILKPSEGELKEDLKDDIAALLDIHRANNAPFVYDSLPFLENAHDYDFAFLDNKSSTVVDDIESGAKYHNSFDLIYDSFVTALKKLNFSDLKIMVGMVGWPTDSLLNTSTPAEAERYFKDLLPYVASNKGTPLRPGAPIDIYVHSLTDENMNGYSTTRHWGIYRSNGKPKFKIDLTGQGRDIFPPTAKGIMQMPQRWCIYNLDRSNPGLAANKSDFACNYADCSTLSSDSSCGNLTFELSVSYAFNLYFQLRFQDENACDFDGLGKVTINDPSTESCFFPVEVVKGQQKQYYIEGNTNTTSDSKMEKHYDSSSTLFLGILFSLFVMWILISADFMITTEQLMKLL